MKGSQLLDLLHNQNLIPQSYSSRLAALKFEDPVTKDNLMGNDDTASKQSIFSKSTNLRNKGTIFTIGNRGEILNQQLEAPILVPHAQQKVHQYPYEALFRSEQYALVDNACREYLFCTEFFMVRGGQAQDMFNQVMGKTLTLLIVSIKSDFVIEYLIKLFISIEKCRNIHSRLL